VRNRGDCHGDFPRDPGETRSSSVKLTGPMRTKSLDSPRVRSTTKPYRSACGEFSSISRKCLNLSTNCFHPTTGTWIRFCGTPHSGESRDFVSWPGQFLPNLNRVFTGSRGKSPWQSPRFLTPPPLTNFPSVGQFVNNVLPFYCPEPTLAVRRFRHVTRPVEARFYRLWLIPKLLFSPRHRQFWEERLLYIGISSNAAGTVVVSPGARYAVLISHKDDDGLQRPREAKTGDIRTIEH